jgi:hypothetical protein
MEHGFIVRQLRDAPRGVFRGRYIDAGHLDPDKVTDWAGDITSLGEYLGEMITCSEFLHRNTRIRDEVKRVRHDLLEAGANAFVDRPPSYVLRDLSRLLYHMGDLCNPDVVDGDVVDDAGAGGR